MASKTFLGVSSNDDATDSETATAQKSEGKIKGPRGPKHKFKKILKLSPPTSLSSTPEPVRRTSSSSISVTEDDKSEHQDLSQQVKWSDPVQRSSESFPSTKQNSSQTKVSTSPPSHIHVFEKYRAVTQRGHDYTTTNDLVSL